MKKSFWMIIGRVTAGVFFLIIAGSQFSFAHFSIGTAYYQRKESPQNGFGVRMENDVKLTPKIIRPGIQAYFDYYSEQNNLSRDGISMGKIDNYTLGILALVLVLIRLINQLRTTYLWCRIV